MLKMHEYLSTSCADEDIVLFVDGFDVRTLQPPRPRSAHALAPGVHVCTRI